MSCLRKVRDREEAAHSPSGGLGLASAPFHALTGQISHRIQRSLGPASYVGEAGMVLFPCECVGPRRCPLHLEAWIPSIPIPPSPVLHLTIPGVPGFGTGDTCWLNEAQVSSEDGQQLSVQKQAAGKNVPDGDKHGGTPRDTPAEPFIIPGKTEAGEVVAYGPTLLTPPREI